jgi:hypothetical protein
MCVSHICPNRGVKPASARAARRSRPRAAATTARRPRAANAQVWRCQAHGDGGHDGLAGHVDIKIGGHGAVSVHPVAGGRLRLTKIAGTHRSKLHPGFLSLAKSTRLPIYYLNISI